MTYFEKNANWLQFIMAIFSKIVHWIVVKIIRLVHLGIMHFLSKNHENPTYQLQDMPISISALLQMNMNPNVLQLNFLNQYFTKYKLGLAKIFQARFYQSHESSHQNSKNPTSQISRNWVCLICFLFQVTHLLQFGCLLLLREFLVVMRNF